ARECGAVRADVAFEGARRDDDGQTVRLAEHPQRTTAEIRPGCVTPIRGERAVDDLHATAAHEHRSPAAALGEVSRAVPRSEAHVLDRELRLLLVLTMRGRPDQRLVARVHGEDAPLSGAAERHLAAAVEHDDR